MLSIKRKLFFERTKEMEETSKNWKSFKKSLKSKAKKIGENIKHPKDTLEKIETSTKKSWKKYTTDPSEIKRTGKKVGKKAIKFVKENPRDAVYIGAEYTVLPALVGKMVGKTRGPKAGVAAAALTTALPIGEAAIGIDHFVRSKFGKTAIKAGGQVIKGTGEDIKKAVLRKK